MAYLVRHPTFLGIFWIRGDLIDRLSQKADLEKKFELLPLDLKDDKSLQS